MANLPAIGTFSMSTASGGVLWGRTRRRSCFSHYFIGTVSANNALLLLASLSTFFIPFKTGELLLQTLRVLAKAVQ
jgi:hypothetical protein